MRSFDGEMPGRARERKALGSVRADDDAGTSGIVRRALAPAPVGNLQAAAASGPSGPREGRGEGAAELEEQARLPVGRERRRDGRVGLGVPARAQGDATELVGTLQNVSVSGALLVTEREAVPAVGMGLEVTFRLPTGPQLRLASTVRWRRLDEPVGAGSSGLQFLNVAGPNRAYLEHYVELAAGVTGEESICAEVQQKYHLAFDPSGRGQAMLGGMLSRDEAQAFAALLKQRFNARKSGRMHIAIDVRRLCVCNQDVLLELRSCFDFMAQCPDVVGLLVGGKSLALTQLVRAAREAGLADHVFCVNEPEDACRIWDQMDGVGR